MPAADLVIQATEHLRAGRHTEAETLYRHSLKENQDLPEAAAGAWHGLGLVALHTQRPAQALEYFDQALAGRAEAGFHMHRGLACLALGHRSDAIAAFRKEVTCHPTLAEAHNNLANALWQDGPTEEALAHWQQAVQLRPNYADARLNLAHALIQREQFEAAQAHAQAVVTGMASSRACMLLGQALTGLHQYQEALAMLREAVRRESSRAEAWGELGLLLARLGQPTEAVNALQQALRQQPNDASLHNALGAIHAQNGRLPEALHSLEEALRLQPSLAAAYYNRGRIWMEQWQFDQAITSFYEALQHDPHLREAHRQLALAYERQGDLDNGLSVGREAVRRWPDDGSCWAALANVLAMCGDLAEARIAYEQAVRLRPEDSVAHSCFLCTLLYLPDLDKSILQEAHRTWAEAHAQVPRLGPSASHDRDPDRPLRVGYLSRDFGSHILTRFLVPIIVHHDPSRVQAHLFADLIQADTLATALRSYAVGWHPVGGLLDEAVAERVRAERIDFLVDLDGHCGGRLGVLARQPAPVQITYLGYPCGTGLPIPHYRLTDAVVEPPDEEPDVPGGEPVRLPAGFSCFAPRLDAPPVTPLPGETNGFLTFGSMHKLAKLNGQVLDLWVEVLRAVPRSRLLIYRDSLRGSVAEKLRAQFRSRGLQDEQLEIRAAAPGEDYLKVYGTMDILLDVFPWSGHATACEALWQGVPVLTLRGNRYAGRMVSSVLTQVGLSEWIAQSPEEYLTLARHWAANRSGLSELRADLRERMRLSPACNGRSFTHYLEEVYRQLWQRWCRGEEPTQGIGTPAIKME